MTPSRFLQPVARAGLASCLLAFCLTGVAPGTAWAAAPSAAAALGLRPVQADVPYQQVPAAEVDQCTVRDIEREDWSGWEVYSPDGRLLRRFADSNGDKKVDLWCYFDYGVEVYRDIDANFNGKADQYRWLATAGLRWGLDENEDGAVDRWKRISAEETTAELVAALATGDAARFNALLASGRDLRDAGLQDERLASLEKKGQRAAAKFASFAQEQKVIGSDAEWLQFAAAAPGLVPAGEPGVAKDVVAYENAVAMFESGGKAGQLLVGTLIEIGDAWKLVDLPVLAAPGEAIAQSSGFFFTPAGLQGGGAGETSTEDSATPRLVSALEAIDARLAQADDAKELAKLHEQRAVAVERIVAETNSPEDRENWIRQLIDTVSVAAQSGQYPDGLKRLKQISRSLRGADQSLRAYAEYQTIGVEHIARQTADADFAKIQEWWLEELTAFADRYPQAPETAQAKLQLALSKEFEDKESDALQFYKEVARDFRGTEAAERAAGAIRRLESVGKVVELEGRTLQGKSFALRQLRGRPVIVHYWATWCEPCKQDMKLLRNLQARYQRAGLQIVGVNIDNRAEQAVEFLRGASLPWVQLYEEGGLEASPLAKQFGVQTLPTMMLIDEQGRVVRHNVRAAELDDELAELVQRR